MEARSHGGLRTRELLRPNQNESKTIMNNGRVVHGTVPSKNRNNAVEINMTGAGGEDTSYCGSFASCLIFTFSVILIVLTFPFSLFWCINMVQEYERAVIFRLGRVKSGIFFRQFLSSLFCLVLIFMQFEWLSIFKFFSKNSNFFSKKAKL